MEIIQRGIEKIEKKGEPIVLGVKRCKSFRKALETLIGTQYKKGNTELEFYTRGLLELYNKFHKEKIITQEIERWKGKSSFQIINELDRIIIIKYQKFDKNEEPKEIKTEVTKEELQTMIDSILRLKDNQPIKTKNLSMLYSHLLGLNHSGWKKGDNPIFSDRKFHNKYTLILGAFDELGLIKYSKGNITILNKDISIQLIL